MCLCVKTGPEWIGKVVNVIVFLTCSSLNCSCLHSTKRVRAERNTERTYRSAESAAGSSFLFSLGRGRGCGLHLCQNCGQLPGQPHANHVVFAEASPTCPGHRWVQRAATCRLGDGMGMRVVRASWWPPHQHSSCAREVGARHPPTANKQASCSTSLP